jgi:hypothetical protein
MNSNNNSRKINWKKEVMPTIKERLNYFNLQGILPTLRTMFYALVSLNIIPNIQSQYQYLSKFTANARMTGELPIDCFGDQSRSILEEFNDDFLEPKEYLKLYIDELESFPEIYKSHIPKWHNQPHYVEVWIEKDAMSGTFQSILKDGSVRIVPNKGFSSLSFIHQNIERLKFHAKKGKEIHIRYFGDLDPSGENIEEVIKDKLNIFEIDVDFRRIAVTEDQMKKFQLPENPNPEAFRKLKRDPRSASFVRKHGRLFQIELDALQAYAPEEFKQLVLESVNEFYNQQIYDDLLKPYSHDNLKKLLKKSVLPFANRINRGF